ncbi:MAG: Hsp20/alpha crystallin family protein [Rhodoferax sp.]|nr:Hsp20/alpha crystallin family protein [Rhodoferax sp.]
MQGADPRTWMLLEAVGLLESAERLQRQFFGIGSSIASPCWEPPVDMIGNDEVLGIWVALPGVPPDRFQVAVENTTLIVRGERALAASLVRGAILRLEIPYGRFERRIDLPVDGYQLIDAQLEHGCLRLLLERTP